jgi:protein-S-isoprenylcysteine O-methyltransferase Ste14
MPPLSRVFEILPVAVLVWMAIGAGFIFRPDLGRRDPRGLGIVVSLWGMLGVMRFGTPAPLGIAAIGLAGLAIALVIFHWAAYSIRGRLFSYAGNDDLPQFVHTSGPYAYVRNPFYLSYLLTEISTIVLWPSVGGAVFIVLATLYFQWLARYEEAKFARSPVAEEYARYKARTGRLLPRLSSVAASRS